MSSKIKTSGPKGRNKKSVEYVKPEEPDWGQDWSAWGTPPQYYVTTFPRIVDRLGLSPPAFRLFYHYWQVLTETGRPCFENTRTLAKACGMSTGAVTNAKRELNEAALLSYIRRGSRESNQSDEVTLAFDELWAESVKTFGEGQARPVHNMNRSGEPVHNMNAKSKKNNTLPSGQSMYSSSSSANASSSSASGTKNVPSATRGGKRSAGKPGQPALFRGAPSGARTGADVGDLRTRKQAKHEKLDIGLLRAGFRLCYLTSGAHGEPPVSDRQAGQMAQTLRALIGAGVEVTPQHLEWYGLWWAKNYRSKPREDAEGYKPPLPRQVQELWAEAMQGREKLWGGALDSPAQAQHAATVDRQAADRIHAAMAAHAAGMRGGQHD